MELSTIREATSSEATRWFPSISWNPGSLPHSQELSTELSRNFTAHDSIFKMKFGMPELGRNEAWNSLIIII
jgi:hypothetical protein